MGWDRAVPRAGACNWARCRLAWLAASNSWARAQGAQLAAGLGRQLVTCQRTRAHGAHLAQLFAQHGQLLQRGLDQGLGVALGAGVEAAGVEQLVAQGQQLRHQLGVACQALRGRQGTVGHGQLQRLPVLAQAGKLGHQIGGDFFELRARCLQRLVERVAHGGPACCQLRVATEGGCRQATMGLREAHGLAQLLQRRHGPRLSRQGPHLAQLVTQIQSGGQGHHEQGNAAQDRELVRQAQAIEYLHGFHSNVSNCSSL